MKPFLWNQEPAKTSKSDLYRGLLNQTITVYLASGAQTGVLTEVHDDFIELKTCYEPPYYRYILRDKIECIDSSEESGANKNREEIK